MKRDIVFKRDCLIVKILNDHKGRENVISAKEIATVLAENGFPTNISSIRPIIKKIREERCIPVCFDNSNGYYMPNCRADIEAVINNLEARAEQLIKHAEFLKGFIF